MGITGRGVHIGYRVGGGLDKMSVASKRTRVNSHELDVPVAWERSALVAAAVVRRRSRNNPSG
jgi:hypothetical protein